MQNEKVILRTMAQEWNTSEGYELQEFSKLTDSVDVVCKTDQKINKKNNSCMLIKTENNNI